MHAKPSLRVVPETAAGVCPLVRWAGGKRWFVKEYGDDMFHRVIQRGGRYIEPFLGGGAMALHLGLACMTLGDIEDELMVMYQAVRDDAEGLITLLSLMNEFPIEPKTYYAVRDAHPRTDLETAARMLYLNSFCWNGVYRKNKAGVFNVPFGDGKGSLPKPDHVRAASRALRGSRFYAGCDAIHLIDEAKDGDTIYADPPYDGTYSSYSAAGFDHRDQINLAKSLKRAWDCGVEIYAHNSDTELVRDLYSWAELVPMPERRAINSDSKARGKVPCVLIVGDQG